MSEDTSKEDNIVEPTKPIGEISGIEEITSQLPDNTLQEITLTPQQVIRLKNSLQQTAILGSQAMLPMICKGPKCPIAASCMLQQINKAPIGQECPIELAHMLKLKDDLIESLDIDWNDVIERQAVMDLVETEILQTRANGILSEEGFVMENVVGVSESTGEPIMRKEKHIALEVKDMIYKRKERLLKSLVATKEMKRKLGGGTKDPSTNQADLLSRLRKSRARDIKEVIDVTGKSQSSSSKNEGSSGKDNRSSEKSTNQT